MSHLDYKPFVGVFGLGVLSFLSAVVARIGPPWPGEMATAIYAAVLSAVMLVITWAHLAKANTQVRQQRLRLAFIAFCVSFAVFLVAKLGWCYDAPDWRHQVAGGLVLRDAIAEILAEDENYTVEKALEGSHFDAMQIWEPWSVRVVRFVLLASWLVTFGAVAAMMAHFALPPPRSQPAVGGVPASHEMLETFLARPQFVSEQFRELREGITKAVGIAEHDPDMALTRLRKVLEYVVRDIYEAQIKEAPGTRPLENLLQRLVKDGHFPDRLDAYAAAIRKLGNVGTHSFGEKISTADVHQSLMQLLPILEWYAEAKNSR